MKRLLACALVALSTAAFGITLSPITLLNPAGSTAGQVIMSSGATSAPAWQSVTFGVLPQMAANTVLANATGSAATPAAFAMPSCSGANSALLWTSGTGFTCGASRALTTGNLSQFAATTSAQLAGVLSDETGSGAAVFGTSPTITTPTINGVTNGAAAAAGVVGQVLVATGDPSMTSTAAANIATLSLPAGQWLVWGSISYKNGTSGTALTLANGGISTTSATLPARPNYSFALAAAANELNFAVPMQPMNVTTTTTVYLVGACIFSGGSTDASGALYALRVR